MPAPNHSDSTPKQGALRESLNIMNSPDDLRKADGDAISAPLAQLHHIFKSNLNTKSMKFNRTAFKGITIEKLEQVFKERVRMETHDGKGVLVWNTIGPNPMLPMNESHRKAFNQKYANKIITTKGKKGYIRCKIYNEQFYAHHVVWIMTHHRFPDEGLEIDHINQVRDDNRPENLRAVDKKTNALNRKSSNIRKPLSTETVRREEVDNTILGLEAYTWTRSVLCPLNNIVTKDRNGFEVPCWRVEQTDSRHVEDLKKDLELKKTTEFLHPLVVVRPKGSELVYLADGYHRYKVLKKLRNDVMVDIVEVEGMDQVSEVARRIAAYYNTCPTRSLTRKEFRQEVYRLLSLEHHPIQEMSDRAIEKAYPITRQTVAKMRSVISYMKAHEIEPSGMWSKDMLADGGDDQALTRSELDILHVKKMWKMLNGIEGISDILSDEVKLSELLMQAKVKSSIVKRTGERMQMIEKRDQSKMDSSSVLDRFM